MKVFMRHEDDLTGHEIGEVPLIGVVGHLVAIIGALKNGVHCASGEDITDASFQFVYDADNGAFAEIILNKPEEEQP